MRAVGAKRPRGLAGPGSDPAVPWTGRVPKPAMDKDSWVDYGSGFLRKSCDSCVSSKRRCDGQDPCTRCLRRKKPCHYTERKKCGPRSGQKTPKGPRRAVSGQAHSADPQQHRGQPAHRTGGATSMPVPDGALDSRYVGLRLGAPPHPHATPTLSAGELSGETTCVDYADSSDGLPPQQMLLRDVSGSSWYAVDEQGTASTPPTVNASWSQQQGGVMYGSVGVHRCQTEQGGGGRQGGESWEGEGVPAGAAEGGGSASGGSGGSGGDSSEDDGSEESLGQEEEEVAALLVRLGKTTTYWEGFSEDEAEGVRSPPGAGPDAQISRPPDSQRCWSLHGGAQERM